MASASIDIEDATQHLRDILKLDRPGGEPRRGSRAAALAALRAGSGARQRRSASGLEGSASARAGIPSSGLMRWRRPGRTRGEKQLLPNPAPCREAGCPSLLAIAPSEGPRLPGRRRQRFALRVVTPGAFAWEQIRWDSALAEADNGVIIVGCCPVQTGWGTAPSGVK